MIVPTVTYVALSCTQLLLPKFVVGILASAQYGTRLPVMLTVLVGSVLDQ